MTGLFAPGMFGGLKVMFSANAVETTQERLFPYSKHRSKRIHKKLVKRFGSEFKMKPAIFQMGDKIIAHPAYKAEFDRLTHQ